MKFVKQFPFDLIQPTKCLLDGKTGAASIEVGLLPFVFNGVVVETSIQLSSIAIPSISVVELQGRSFDFPVNPASGYIDGSIYLDGAHHPVDVTKLSFTIASVKLVGMFVFEFEGLPDYRNTAFELIAPIENAR
jgi:hypothetical protein